MPRLTKPAALALAIRLCAALSAPCPAWAQAAPAPGTTLLPGASSHEPINIAADKLDYFDKDKKAVYTGNVVAVQGESRLNATVLTILFENKAAAAKPVGVKAAGAKAAAAPAVGPGGGGSQMRRVEGKGPITLTSKDQVGTGDALVYDKPENKFYLIGNVALSQGDNVTRGDKLIYDLGTGQAVVTSAGRVHSLIIPNDNKPAPAKPASAKPAH